MIDLRSDTVTKPTPEMRRAMMEAEVGDDVYGEDPTVNLLESRAAAITGKEAALFVPTGTMGNTIAVKLHTRHGEEVICDVRAHVLEYELSMLAWFSGCVGRPLPTADGIMSWEQSAPEIRPLGPHRARTALVEIENTNNIAGGTVYPLALIHEICDQAHERGLRVHMDGARVFNAAEALSKPVREIVAGHGADSGNANNFYSTPNANTGVIYGLYDGSANVNDGTGGNNAMVTAVTLGVGYTAS